MTGSYREFINPSGVANRVQATVVSASPHDIFAGIPLHMPKELLVVDDDNVHRTIICRLGEKAGFRSIGAESYKAAAEVLQDRKIDLITLDLSLGDRFGGEVMGLLSMSKCKCPIIVISGTEAGVFEEVVGLGKGLDLDIRAAMVKPINLGALRQELVQISEQIEEEIVPNEV
jgi:DNA-binding response OmpR family regulator